MNIKVQVNAVKPVLDQRVAIGSVFKQLEPLAQKAQLMFIEPQAGAGYLQWSLPGSDWIPFTQGTEAQKDGIAQTYKARKGTLESALGNSPIKEAIFTVPSADYIFFRKNGESWDIAFTAWGYKFPDKWKPNELETWLVKNNLQKVKIGFSWAEQLLNNFSFKLNNQSRMTGADGIYHVDNELPVGDQHQLEILDGTALTLIVEQGKQDYIYDLTQYFFAEIEVTQDNIPAADRLCNISFDGKDYSLTTSQSGSASVRIPLACTPLGIAASPQPECTATCDTKEQVETPLSTGGTVRFVFNFKTEAPPSPTPSEKHAKVEIEVFKGEEPLNGQVCEVSFNSQTKRLTTDVHGFATMDIVLPTDEQGNLILPQPTCEVVCQERHEEKRPESEGDILHFRFTFDADKPLEEKDPEYVYIQLKDYGGVPMPDLLFFLTTKKKGRQTLTTDSEGICKVPKEWFSPKEKMIVDFIVSTEYQKAHDLHDSKNNKNKK